MSQQAYLQRLYDDLPFFVTELWEITGLARKAEVGWVERDILEYAQHGPSQQIILAARGMGKTHLIAGGYVMWRLFRNPDTKIAIISKSEGQAKDTITLLRGWINTVPFLQHLRPQRDQRDSAIAFDVGSAEPSRTASVTAKGIGGQLESSRADLIVADDVETRQNTLTLKARADLAERVHEFASIASYGDQEVLYVGTYHHEESLYLTLQSRGYDVRTWPALAPHADMKVVGLAPSIQKRIDDGRLKPCSAKDVFDGDIVADYRISESWITKQKKEGARHFAMQQMLIAGLGDTNMYPLRLKDLIVFPVHRDKAPISIAWGMTNDKTGTTRIEDITSLGFGTDGLHSPIFYDEQWSNYSMNKAFIDPAGRGGDELAVAGGGFLHGYIYVKFCVGLADGPTPDNLEAIALLLRAHRITEVTIETNFGGEFLIPLFQPVLQQFHVLPNEADETGETYPNGWTCHIEPKHSVGQKEVRIIDTLEPVMTSHRLIVSRDAIEPKPGTPNNKTLQYQLTRITRQRGCLDFDDRADALAGMVSLFKSELHTNPERAAERQRARWVEEEMKKWRKQRGMSERPASWIVHESFRK